MLHWDLLTLLDGTIVLFCNNRNQIPSDAAAHPRRTGISVNARVLIEAVQVTQHSNYC
jgi:hypothetical protein